MLYLYTYIYHRIQWLICKSSRHGNEVSIRRVPSWSHQASTATTASRPSLGRGGEWFCWFFNSIIGKMAYDCVNQNFKHLYMTQIQYITYAKYIVLKTGLETKTLIIIWCYFRLLPSKWPFDHITDAHLKNATGVKPGWHVSNFQTIQQPWHPPNKCGETLSA